MITAEQLAAHKKWLNKQPEGRQLIIKDANLIGANLEGAELCLANLTNANMQGAILNGADLRQAVLDGVNLSHANLRSAKLDSAYIRNANLSNADLIHANLRDADLRYSDLNSTDLRNADLRYILFRCADLTNVKGLPIAADAPERLKAVASAALQCDALNMDAWHTCDTQHCIAGWAVHLAGEPGRIIESMMGTEIAGLYLLGIEAHAHFFKNDKEAKEFLQNVLASTSK